MQEGCGKRSTDKYRDINLCDMTAEEREDFLSNIARRGAVDALKAVGLSDVDALTDIRDLRDLLKGFRVVRKSIVRTTLASLGRVIGWIIVVSIVSFVVGHSGPAKNIIKLITE